MILKPEDAARLIAQTRSENTVLIGGQAVAFWIGQFNIRPQLSALTVDIDFLGTRKDARRASARLAIEIAAAFIEQKGMSQRNMLDAIETIGRFTATQPARFAADTFKLDCLKAIPPSVLREGILPEDFHKKRWPQILAAAGRR